MVVGMRHTAVLVLGFVLLALVTACGDTASTPPDVSIPEPSPDIEATVEAKVQDRLRIEEKQAVDAAPKAKAQAMAKAIVEATAQAAPTLIPAPPTPTPTQTPTPMATPAPPKPTPTQTPTPAFTPLPQTVRPTPTTTVSDNGKSHMSAIDSSGANWNYLSAEESDRDISPPNPSAIAVDYDRTSGNAHVTGGAGAVPAGAAVLVANMELGGVVLVRADSAGAFETSLPASPGTHMLIKQDSTGQMIDLYDGVEEVLESSSKLSVPGIILSIPAPESANGYGFAGAARVSGNGPAWVVEGDLSRIDFQIGDQVTIAGKVSILTNAPPLDEIYYSFWGELIGDENGLQVGPQGPFTSNILTPTGLPIVPGTHSGMGIFFHDCGDAPLGWSREQGRLVADFSCDAGIGIDTPDLKADPPAGTYVIRLALHFPGTHIETMEQLQTEKRLKMGSNHDIVSLATVTVGSPKPLRLATTLFADLLQEGTRGGVFASEDSERLAISPRIITNHNPVIPRLDPYGDSLKHRLDPYVPLFGMTDRAPPAVPFIEFDFPNSNVQITVERPDGKTDVFGPSPLVAFGVKTPILPGGNQIAGGGGHIGEIPQLLAKGDVFEYQFPLDGDYVVRLAGQVADANGQTFEIAGTYDLTVANSLDIETLLLPGTPFEIGDSLPIGLQVYPGVPAEINFTVTHVGADNVIHEREYAGASNSNGYWDGEGQFYVFETAGEYRVDVEARYTGEDSALWVGRMTYGSAVATHDGPIIAHGRRGKDGLDYIPPPWGFGADFSSDGHLQFPFFTGDILWGIEGPEPNRENGNTELGPGDSVNALLSFQAVDIEHPLVVRATKQVEDRNMQFQNYGEMVQAGQIPLITSAEPNSDGSGEWFEGFRPEDFSLLAYTYSSAQRPGVRVREMIAGDDMGTGYWRFHDAYHMQSGNSPYEGDLPGDFKFLYGATVIRDIELNEGVFAIYGSGWVLAQDDDPMGSRFMPPFQGNAGGPNGGPLFNVHGRNVDMFFLPLGVRPGSVLEVGDIFRMAGPIMPTLPSKVEYALTAPDGAKRTFKGRANSVGYYYVPADDFALDQPGLWTVALAVTHDGMTSAGPVQAPYPSGGPLTPDGHTFTFVVTDSDTHKLGIVTDLARLKPTNWYGTIQQARFEALLPQGWTGETAHLTVTMPGIVLDESDVQIEDGAIRWLLKGEEMNRLANNFDYETGLADTITVNIYAEEQSGRQAAGAIVTHGARVPLAPAATPVPAISKWPTGQASCLPNEIELFSSDFESGTAGWDFSDSESWFVVNMDGSKVLRGAGHVHAHAGINWDEVVWRMRVKLSTGNTHLNFHAREDLRYLISFAADWTQLIRGDSTIQANANRMHQEWYVVEISLLDNIFRVAVDGVIEIEQQDPNPLPPGGIWLEVLDKSVVLFDDVYVCEPSD